MPESGSSDSIVTLEQIKLMIRDFCEERDWDQFHTAKDLSIGLSTEASELLEIFRFQTERQIEALLATPGDREKIADELADCLFFLLRFAGRFDFDLAMCFKNKLDKNARKYPVELAYGSNQKRTL